MYKVELKDYPIGYFGYFHGVELPERSKKYFTNRGVYYPDQSLAYMAASIRHSIDAYKSIAGMDISDNPGIIAEELSARLPDLEVAGHIRARRSGVGDSCVFCRKTISEL